MNKKITCPVCGEKNEETSKICNNQKCKWDLTFAKDGVFVGLSEGDIKKYNKELLEAKESYNLEISQDSRVYREDGSLEYEDFYDEEGYLESCQFYNVDGSKAENGIYLYSEEGFLTGCNYYKDNGILWYIDLYAEEGGVRSRQYYNVDGSLQYEDFYNKEGYQESCQRYNADGSKAANGIYLYSEEGFLIGCNYYKDNGILWYINLCDEEGNVKSSQYYNADGSLWYEDFYDEEGGVKSRQHYNVDGSKAENGIYLYSEEGFLIACDFYTDNGSHWYSDVYDEKGYLDTRFFYDDKGDIVCTQLYDKNGNLTFEEITKYLKDLYKNEFESKRDFQERLSTYRIVIGQYVLLNYDADNQLYNIRIEIQKRKDQYFDYSFNDITSLKISKDDAMELKAKSTKHNLYARILATQDNIYKINEIMFGGTNITIIGNNHYYNIAKGLAWTVNFAEYKVLPTVKNIIANFKKE